MTPHLPNRPTPHRAWDGGFTLIELLVALTVMALLAVLSWRSIDGMSRTNTALSFRSDEILTLRATISQFKSDLDAITQTPRVSGLDWDGRVLRLTRLSSVPGEGLQVIAWTRRFDDGGKWMRWQSPATTVYSQWRQSWEQASAWAQNPTPESQRLETFTVPLAEWQIFYFRNNAWSNPLSSEGASAAPQPPTQQPPGLSAQVSTPDGIRLVLNLPPSQGVAGKLTLDWVRPNLSGDKP